MAEKQLGRIMIIDGSYMLHRSLKTPELWDLKNKNGIRTGGVFGFLRSLGASLRIGEYFPVICWDSGRSPRRLTVYPNYKHNMDKTLLREADKYALMLLNGEIAELPAGLSQSEREAVEEALNKLKETKEKWGSYENPDDYSSQYLRQRDTIISICHSLGVPSILISFWEGDDLIALLSRLAQKSLIVTDDKDMLQLLSPDVEIYRALAKQHLQYGPYLAEMGISSSREFVIAKAIAGDASDNIPSVTEGEAERKYRIGEKTAARIAKIIAQQGEDSSRYLGELLKIGGREQNKIQGFVRNHSLYLRNMQLVDLSLVENDVQVISTVTAEIQLKAGKCRLFEAISKLSDADIASVDVNGMIAQVMRLSKSALFA